MVQASDPHKRPLSEDSSQTTAKVKNKIKKGAKKSTKITGHLPSGICPCRSSGGLPWINQKVINFLERNGCSIPLSYGSVHTNSKL